MAKKDHVDRSMADKRAMLKEQIGLLISYADSYDAGQKAFAKPMAASLRLLIHQTKNSIPLLHQLGLRQGRFFASVKEIDQFNLATQCGLVVIGVSSNGFSYMAITEPLGFRQRISFPEWWSTPIIKGKGGMTMCRRQIVISIADMDGGAHVDPTIEKVYNSFRAGELLGWSKIPTPMGIGLQVPIAEDNIANGDLVVDPQYACVRTITHELLLTMQKYAPWSFEKPYHPKTME